MIVGRWTNIRCTGEEHVEVVNPFTGDKQKQKAKWYFMWYPKRRNLLIEFVLVAFQLAAESELVKLDFLWQLTNNEENFHLSCQTTLISSYIVGYYNSDARYCSNIRKKKRMNNLCRSYLIAENRCQCRTL